MKRVLPLIITCLLMSAAAAQTDYTQMANWYYHPDKLINIIGNYNLDIAAIAPDLYIDTTYAITNNAETDTGIDVFWVHPTQLTDAPTTPTTVPIDDQPTGTISATILAQGGLLARYGRFFAPRYRQATPAAFLDADESDEVRAEAIIAAYRDVKAAFLHYMQHHNNGNKIIVAGHSQGSLLLGLLLRDVFDNDAALRSQLLTAVLGGMAYFHAEKGTYSGGQWENIPLCTRKNQCECIHTWRSFKESQTVPGAYTTLPIFNSTLVDSGLVYRVMDTETDWLVQDSLYYNSTPSVVKNYVTPDASYNLGGDANYIALDSMYVARYKRNNDTNVSLAVDYINDANDQRPNDLMSVENSQSFVVSGFHQKDYHIYLWAIMDMIDTKINECVTVSTSPSVPFSKSNLVVYPNPNRGSFTVNFPDTPDEYYTLVISDILGNTVKTIITRHGDQVHLAEKGIYVVTSPFGSQKLIVF